MTVSPCGFNLHLSYFEKGEAGCWFKTFLHFSSSLWSLCPDLCPFLYRVCGLFVAAFTGSLNVWNKHTISTSSVMSVISFQFAVCPLIFFLYCIFLHRILFQKVKCIIFLFLLHFVVSCFNMYIFDSPDTFVEGDRDAIFVCLQIYFPVTPTSFVK